MGVFAILGLISSSLQNARYLQRPMVDAGVIASQLSLTNQLVEGDYSMDLGDLLGKEYNGYVGDYTVQEELTNKLFRVDFQVINPNKVVVSQYGALFFRPQSPAGTLDGATK